MDTSELKAWLRLALTFGVGNLLARQLLAAFGSPQAVFSQHAVAWHDVGGDKLVTVLADEPPTLEEQLRLTQEWANGSNGRCIVTLGDPGYPVSLLHTEDPPLMLYLLGSFCPSPVSPDIFGTASLAIVGSRNPTPQGEANARQFAKAFGQAGLCVVSGLALGVDGAAHDGALLGGGTTIAVVGTGLDRVYPQKHLALAHRIAEQGLIISEYPLGTPPLAHHFPRRNRLISGLSRGTLVVEAALKSGSLITARMAAEQGKDVFAIPGSIHSPQSRGCHALIKQGAKLVETAEDVLEELRVIVKTRQTTAGHLNSAAASDMAEVEVTKGDGLMAALGFDATSLDALQSRTGMPTPQLQARLLELELEGQVVRLPGGLFQRMRAA